jgi:DNA-binding protein YbaB
MTAGGLGDDWATAFAAKAQRYQAAQEQAERLRSTAKSSDGAVSVTVGADGGITDLTFGNKVKSFPLDELSRTILTTMRRAQSGIASGVAGVMAEQLGDEDRETRAELLDALRGRFPAPDEPDELPAPPESGGQAAPENNPW